MDNFGLEIFALGALRANCYLTFDPKTKSAFLIDPGTPSRRLNHFIGQNNLNVEFILLTHGHFDHIGGVDDFDKPFYIHPADAPFLADARLNASAWHGCEFTVSRRPVLISEDKPLVFCTRRIEVIPTPGHTPGSVCFKMDKWLFSGDTLFYESIGRTDIPLGSHEAILRSVREKLFVLDDDFTVYPGHAAATNLGYEKKNNPFVR